MTTLSMPASDDWPVFEHKLFKFEVTETRIQEDKATFVLQHTNLQEVMSWGHIEDFKNTVTYMIDQAGVRYDHADNANLAQHTSYPSGVPVRLEITFVKSKTSEQAFFTFQWKYRKPDLDYAYVQVIFNKIPLMDKTY
jgi:hypothetical protein